MKVVYETLNVIEGIDRARQEALREQREIKEIVLTIAEGFKLIEELQPATYNCVRPLDFEAWLHYAGYLARHQQPSFEAPPQPMMRVMGINIKVSW